MVSRVAYKSLSTTMSSERMKGCRLKVQLSDHRLLAVSFQLCTSRAHILLKMNKGAEACRTALLPEWLQMPGAIELIQHILQVQSAGTSADL